MSVLHHESILEQCLEEAIEEFCSNNQLTPEMFAEIENHEGVQLALEKLTMKRFEDRLQWSVSKTHLYIPFLKSISNIRNGDMIRSISIIRIFSLQK